MFFWSSFPFIRLVIPFGVGVFLASILGVEWNQNLFVPIYVGLLILLSVWCFFNKRIKLNFWSGVLISACFTFLGVAHFSFDRSLVDVRSWEVENEAGWIGNVESVKRKGGVVASFVVKVNQVNLDEVWESLNFNLLVFNRDSGFQTSVGDYVSASGWLKPAMAPQNPTQFNYQTFLDHKNIFLTTFEDDYLSKDGEPSLMDFAQQLREELIETYEKIGIEGQNLAVLIALTLGDKTYLDFELQKQYAGAGAMHILAVSGLHVGIIFLIFNFLLSRLPDSLGFRIIKSFFLLLVIWSFAFLAGLSPSVQRASWMFSFVLMSKLLRRNSNILNSIAASAFFLMLLNPNVIFQVGFQLSYSAVIGIILIHPVVYKWVYCKHWLLDKVWSLLVVSFAAQMATLPFTLAYFHQFPNYFLLANLFVIPLAFATVIGAVLSVCIFLLFQVDLFLGEILNLILTALNYSIGVIHRLPNSVLEGLWFTPVSIILIVVLLISVVLWLHYCRTKYLLVSLSLCVVVFMNEQRLLWQNSQEKQIVFYALSRPAFSYINGLKAEVYYLSGIRDYDRKLVQEYLFSKGIQQVNWSLIMNEENQLFEIGGNSLLFRPTGLILEQLGNAVDYVILDESKYFYSSLESIVFDYNYRKVSDREKNRINGNYINFKIDKAFVVNF